MMADIWTVDGVTNDLAGWSGAPTVRTVTIDWRLETLVGFEIAVGVAARVNIGVAFQFLTRGRLSSFF